MIERHCDSSGREYVATLALLHTGAASHLGSQHLDRDQASKFLSVVSGLTSCRLNRPLNNLGGVIADRLSPSATGRSLER